VNELVLLWLLLAATGIVIMLMVLKHRFPSIWRRWRRRLVTRPPPRPRHSRVFTESSGSTPPASDPREVIRIAEQIRHLQRVYGESGKHRERLAELQGELQQLHPEAAWAHPGEATDPSSDNGPDMPATAAPSREDPVWRKRQLKELEKRLPRPGSGPSPDAE